ncbi:histidine-type phosphatase [Streptomyces orinoci]|uniref:Multiple inositol polyphosphate phosphatase 1 n=1 Tax=Streptomyces orinoci TaxID=67339 RepID=A0ABV3JZ74_STRON|nr:histidine-type phosphatase [Streptomyces orinoci]
MKRTAPLAAAIALSLPLAATAAPSSAQARQHTSHTHQGFYGTKTPYTPQENPARYQHAPQGYIPVFTEHVARHGSRAMTDGDDGETVLALLRRGQEHHALTGLGRRLAPRVRSLLSAASTLGYGNLSALGAQEHRQTAQRMARRLPSLFRAIAAQHRPITVETSGVDRTVASARAFTGGLAAADPALAALIQKPVTDKDLLYFPP